MRVISTILHSSERPLARHPHYFVACKGCKGLLVGQRDLWDVAPADMQQQLFISKFWGVTVGQIDFVSRRREKMFLLIQLPVRGNLQESYALICSVSEYKMCRINKQKQTLQCFALYKPIQIEAIVGKASTRRAALVKTEELFTTEPPNPSVGSS